MVVNEVRDGVGLRLFDIGRIRGQHRIHYSLLRRSDNRLIFRQWQYKSATGLPDIP